MRHSLRNSLRHSLRNSLRNSGTGGLSLLLAALLLMAPVAAISGQDDQRRLRVEGISASLGEDEPRVLYILPWQPPSLPTRPRAKLDDKEPELIRPVDPVALERHRLFRETLNPLILSPLGNSALTVQ